MRTADIRPGLAVGETPPIISPSSDGDISSGTASPLAVREWGAGERVAVLIHGMMSASSCWWQVAPDIAAHGYRVVAVDLPGHGRTAGDSAATMGTFVASLVASVPPRAQLVIAHSMGAYVAAAALERLQPDRVVYLDTPFGPSRQIDASVVSAMYERARRRRTLDHLEEAYPGWDHRDRSVEAAAAEVFDVATAVHLLQSAAGHDFTPTSTVPTLMIRADPSRNVPPRLADELAGLGWLVRSIPGADHSVWCGHHGEFMAALEGWL